MTNKGLILFKTLLVATITLLATSCLKSDGPGDTSMPSIQSFTFEANDLITSAPVITKEDDLNGEIVFTVAAGTPVEQLKFTPTITIPKVCVVTPRSGVEQSFSSGSVKYVVANTNTGNTKTYVVKCVVDNYAEAAITSIVLDEASFDKDKLLSPPTLVDGAYEFRVAEATTQDELKAIVPIIEVSTGATIDPASGVAQDFSDGKSVTYTVTAQNKETKTYELKCIRKSYTEANVVSITTVSSLVIGQPIFVDAANIKLNISKSATESDIAAMVLDIEISEGATLATTPLSLTTPAKYIVTSEDGNTVKEYFITCERSTTSDTILYSFEGWTSKGTGKAMRDDPDGWDSSNEGMASIVIFVSKYTEGFCVLKDANGYAGNAAEIITRNTLGTALIPKITSGSLFLGTFSVDMTNPLKSTKFGIPFDKKQPLKVKGHYKYTPGADFYRAPNNGATGADRRYPVIEEETVDECAMTAVLYKIDDETSPYLDGTNIATDPSIVAIGVLGDGTAKSAYTPFELNMEYKEDYNPSQKYRLAIVFSASKWGDVFSGGHNSNLTVDEVSVEFDEFL